MVVYRSTLFKLKDASSAPQKVAELYKTLETTSSKDGAAYILNLKAGPTADEPRNGGFHFVAHCEFKSKADMDYYDSGDEAHAALKAALKDLAAGPPTIVWFEA